MYNDEGTKKSFENDTKFQKTCSNLTFKFKMCEDGAFLCLHNSCYAVHAESSILNIL